MTLLIFLGTIALVLWVISMRILIKQFRRLMKEEQELNRSVATKDAQSDEDGNQNKSKREG